MHLCGISLNCLIFCRIANENEIKDYQQKIREAQKESEQYNVKLQKKEKEIETIVSEKVLIILPPTPPQRSVGGIYWNQLVCPSVRLSSGLSVSKILSGDLFRNYWSEFIRRWHRFSLRPPSLFFCTSHLPFLGSWLPLENTCDSWIQGVKWWQSLFPFWTYVPWIWPPCFYGKN